MPEHDSKFRKVRRLADKVGLDGIGISGFRSFGPGMQRLEDFSKVNLIVGKNNSGKSNVLRFIERLGLVITDKRRSRNSVRFVLRASLLSDVDRVLLPGDSPHVDTRQELGEVEPTIVDGGSLEILSHQRDRQPREYR